MACIKVEIQQLYAPKGDARNVPQGPLPATAPILERRLHTPRFTALVADLIDKIFALMVVKISMGGY